MPMSSSAFCTRQHGCPPTLTQMLLQRWSLIAIVSSSQVARAAYDTAVRAVVLDHARQPALADVGEPAGTGELVHVQACGLCGSDVEKLGAAPAGTVLGHEVVARTAEGRRVALVHHCPCGTCARCRAGHESTCEQFVASTIVPGGFAERV